MDKPDTAMQLYSTVMQMADDLDVDDYVLGLALIGDTGTGAGCLVDVSLVDCEPLG